MSGIKMAQKNGFISTNEKIIIEKLESQEGISPIIGIEFEFLSWDEPYSENELIEELKEDGSVEDPGVYERDCDNCYREYCESCCEDCDNEIYPVGYEWTIKPASLAYLYESPDNLKNILNDIAYYDGYVNDTCGMHIHLSNITIKQAVRLIKWCFKAEDDELMSTFGRTSCYYANIHSEQPRQMAEWLTRRGTAIANTDFTATYTDYDIISAYKQTQDSRYRAINVLTISDNPADNHIEFRLPSGCIDYNEVMARLHSVQQIMNGEEISDAVFSDEKIQEIAQDMYINQKQIATKIHGQKIEESKNLLSNLEQLKEDYKKHLDYTLAEFNEKSEQYTAQYAELLALSRLGI